MPMPLASSGRRSEMKRSSPSVTSAVRVKPAVGHGPMLIGACTECDLRANHDVFRRSALSVFGAAQPRRTEEGGTPMTALFTPRIRAARGLVALAAIGVCALAASAGPAAADGTAKSAHRAGGKTITLSYYVETVAFVYRRADGTVRRSRRRLPPRRPARDHRARLQGHAQEPRQEVERVEPTPSATSSRRRARRRARACSRSAAPSS